MAAAHTHAIRDWRDASPPKRRGRSAQTLKGFETQGEAKRRQEKGPPQPAAGAKVRTGGQGTHCTWGEGREAPPKTQRGSREAPPKTRGSPPGAQGPGVKFKAITNMADIFTGIVAAPPKDYRITRQARITLSQSRKDTPAGLSYHTFINSRPPGPGIYAGLKLTG